MTSEELGSDIRKLTSDGEAARKADGVALQIEDQRSAGSDAVTASTHADVESAAPGVFAKDDYQSGVSVPSTTASTSSFDRLFNDLKTAFTAAVTEDMNLAVAGSVREAIKVIDELQSLSAVIVSETTKISVAAAAGLLTPPSRSDIEDLKSDGQELRDEMSRSASELRSGQARRRAARDRRGLLENNRQDLVEQHPGIGQKDGRVLEQLTAGSSQADDAPSVVAVEVFAPQPSGSPGLALEGSRQTVADRDLSESSAVLQGSVLDKVSYLAICQALASLDSGNESRDKAQAAYERLQKLVEIITKTLSQSFNSDLLAGVQELVAEGVETLGAALQSKLDAWDQFLNAPVISLPTFVSTVENIGDAASNVSFVESLLASCGLRMDSFCDAQGMLEVARSLDQMMVFEPLRPPALGRACFTLSAPEPVADYQPPITRPDREVKLLLTEAVHIGGTQVKARFSRADVRRSLTTPVPQLPGTLSALVSAGADTVTVSGLTGTPATVGNLRLEPGTMQEEILRYESRAPSWVFTLIDKPLLTHGLASAVVVDGEHRDDFSDVYEQREEIGGGPGVLRLAGDNETAETLTYSGSVFNSATGVYTFTLTAPLPTALHRPQTSGRPSASAKKVLFRPVGSTAPAPRFTVTGALITPVTPGSPPDMTSEIAPGDKLVLSDDVNDTPATVLSVTAVSATLTSGYFNPGNNVSLAKVDERTASGGSAIKARFSQRALDELGVDGSLASIQDIEDFQILVDQDEGTRNLRRGDGVVTAPGSPINRNTLTTSAPVFEAGDAGSVSVQAANGRRLVSGALTYVSPTSVHFDSVITLFGTGATPFSQSGGTFTATGGKLLSELQVGDYIAFGTVRRLVTAITGNTTATVTPAGAVAAVANAWIVAGDGVATVEDRQFSFLRRPRETMIVSSVQRLVAPGAGKPATDGLWTLNLTSPTTRSHGTQHVDVNATVHIIPQSLDAFASQPTSVTPRFEPDVVPPGTLTLRGVFQDPSQAPILGPLLELGGGDVEIGGLSLPYTALAVSGDEATVTLASPGTPRAFEAGTTFCVPTASTVEDMLNGLFNVPTWNVAFESWFSDLDEQLRQLHRRLCRLLQGRPEDLAIVAAATIAGATAFSLSLLTLRVTLEALLAGLGDMGPINIVVGQARDAGMDQAADAMASGDVLAVAQMRSSESTSSGSLLVKLVVYREKLTSYDQSIQADSLAAELKGNQTSIQILAETRAGFKTAAASDITRKTEAAKTLNAKAEIVTR